MNISDEAKPENKDYIFLLFVAGEEPHSKTANDNLEKFCASHLNESFEIKVVDVLESFKIALENSIFLTPALIKIAPAPAATFFGDLSDTNELIKVLGLKGVTNGR